MCWGNPLTGGNVFDQMVKIRNRRKETGEWQGCRTSQPAGCPGNPTAGTSPIWRRRSTPTTPGSPPSVACFAMTRRASRPAPRPSIFRCSFARSRPAIPRARPRPYSTRTSWAACAQECARPKRCARKFACVRLPRENPSRSAGCSAMRPIICFGPGGRSFAAARRRAAGWRSIGAGPAGLGLCPQAGDARP